MLKLDRVEFEKHVLKAIKSLPSEFSKKLNNVDIAIELEPTEIQLRKMHLRRGMVLYGLYEGIPLTDRTNYSMVLPDKITLFQRALESECSTIDELKKQIRNTILHEIGHHFGLSDAELRNI